MNRIQNYLTSMEVAKMTGKAHKNLIRDIRNYVKELGELKIEPSNFFIESTFQSERNQTLSCFKITKEGCEFIAHKLTGLKGTEFTAKYINKFHQMEGILQADQVEMQKMFLDMAMQIIPMVVQETARQLLPIMSQAVHGTAESGRASGEKKKRRRVRVYGKIDVLPTAVKDDVIYKLFQEKMSYADVFLYLKGRGYDISTSSVGRYAQKIYKSMEETKIEYE